MYSYRPLDDALARAVLVGATPEQRAWLGGASGDERQLDGAEAAAAELFCRARARTAQSAECRRTCADALAFVHGTLSRRHRQSVDAHRETCAECAWTFEVLPGLADAVGTVASVYADAMIGPPEAPAGALGRPVPTALRRSHRPVIAVAAATVLGLAGVGAAVAQGWRSDGEQPPAIVEEDVPFEDPTSSPEPIPPSTEPTPDESVEPSGAPSDPVEPSGTATTPGTGAWRPTGGGATPWQQSVPAQPAGPEPGTGEVASEGGPTSGSPTDGGSTPARPAGDGSTPGSTSGGTGGTDSSGTEPGNAESTTPPSGESSEPPGTDPGAEPETPTEPGPTTPTPTPDEPSGDGTGTPEPSPTTDVSDEP